MIDRFANPDSLFRVGVRARAGLSRLPDDVIGEVIVEESPVGPTPDAYYETRGPDPLFEAEVRRRREEAERTEQYRRTMRKGFKGEQ